MAETQNYTWEQGDDSEVELVYKEKADADSPATPVNLTSYSVRMDIAKQSDSVRVWTFNSSDNAGTSPIDEVGPADNEVTLGSDGTISIIVPRSLTLPGGAIHAAVQSGTLVFKYDVFLRTPAGKQKKVLQGTITINPSVTLWL